MYRLIVDKKMKKVIEIKVGDYTQQTKKITLEELKKELLRVPIGSRYFYLDNLINANKITEKEYDWLLVG
jgi:hypothetical protein